MHTRRLLASLLLPIAFLAACGDDDDAATTASEAAANERTLTIDDNGTALDVAVGETIAVELESCPSCGYSWQQMGDAGTGGLELVSANDTNPTATEGQTGGTVTHVVTFEVTAAGESTIALGYFPPTGDAPDEVFSVDLTITE